MADLAAGDLAPNVALTNPTGGRVTPKELLAERPGVSLLLVFFKVTCPVCKLDWPYLQRLHHLYGPQVRLIGVSQNDAESARAYYAENGAAKFELLLDPEPAFTASNAYDVESVPHHVLIAPDGRVRRVFAGWSRREIEEVAKELAAGRDVKYVAVVAEDDPVPVFKPG